MDARLQLLAFVFLNQALTTAIWWVAGTFLGWLTVKGRSVWPAVIGHAAINGITALPILFVQGTPNPLLGPLPNGLIGSLGFSVVALWMFLKDPTERVTSNE